MKRSPSLARRVSENTNDLHLTRANSRQRPWLAFLFPLVWMVLTSLKPIEETMSIPPTWFPTKPQWHNYGDAMAYGSDSKGVGEVIERVQRELAAIQAQKGK